MSKNSTPSPPEKDLTVLAHDLNNMLTIINGCAEMALTLAPREGPLRRPLEDILDAGNRAAEMVTRLQELGQEERN